MRKIDLFQSYCPEDTLDENKDSYDHDRIYLDSNDILAKNNFNDLELNSIFLTMFYSTNITQASFADVMKTFQIMTPYNLPKSFNSCAKKLLDIFGEKIDYLKKWYCVSCAIFVAIEEQHQRNCKNCLKK